MSGPTREEIEAVQALPAAAQVALEGLPVPCWRIYDDGGAPMLMLAPIPGRTHSCWLPVDTAEILVVIRDRARRMVGLSIDPFGATVNLHDEAGIFASPPRLAALRLLAAVYR